MLAPTHWGDIIFEKLYISGILTHPVSLSPAVFTVNGPVQPDGDNSTSIQVDCNQVAADFELGIGGAITVTPGPTTLAQCKDEGLGEAFAQLLGGATNFLLTGSSMMMSSNGMVLMFQLAK